MASLTGAEQGNTINLTGLAQYNTSVMSTDEINLKKLKIYLIENFVEPLIMKRVENVNFNTYNFAYILSRLGELKYIDPGEVSVYEKIVEFVQNTVGTYNQNATMISQLYADKKTTAQFTLNLPFITLKAEYEIYNSLYGRPDAFSYDKKILEEIRSIVKEQPGILFKDVKKILDYRYNDTVLLIKHKIHEEDDPNGKKIEYLIYDRIFDKTLTNNKYQPKILEILITIIKENPTFTFESIKKYFYDNHRYWSQYFLESLHKKHKTLEDRYDMIFGNPIDKNYKKNYINLIREIVNEYPDITDKDLELEFEFRQPIWGEMLLKNQTLNAFLFKDSRFKTERAPDVTF